MPAAETVRARVAHCSTTVPASLMATAVSELVGHAAGSCVTAGEPAAAVPVRYSPVFTRERPSTTPAPLSATGARSGIQLQFGSVPLGGRPPSSVSTPAPDQTTPVATRFCQNVQM